MLGKAEIDTVIYSAVSSILGEVKLARIQLPVRKQASGVQVNTLCEVKLHDAFKTSPYSLWLIPCMVVCMLLRSFVRLRMVSSSCLIFSLLPEGQKKNMKMKSSWTLSPNVGTSFQWMHLGMRSLYTALSSS